MVLAMLGIANAQESFTNEDLENDQAPRYVLRSAPPSVVNLLDSSPPPAEEEPFNQYLVVKGSSYESVMNLLKEYKTSLKTIDGDSLKANYKQASLLAYPDVSGARCELVFLKARLVSCSGCAPNKFNCE